MKKPILLACVLFVLDQLSKFLVDNFIDYATLIHIIKPFNLFNLTNLHNTGIAFSAFQNKNIVFLFFTAIFLLLIAIWLYKNHTKTTKLQKYAFCLVLAGGAGNLTDRIFRGFVVDFLDFGINSLRWASFNVADSCICIAAGLIIIDLIKTR